MLSVYGVPGNGKVLLRFTLAGLRSTSQFDYLIAVIVWMRDCTICHYRCSLDADLKWPVILSQDVQEADCFFDEWLEDIRFKHAHTLWFNNCLHLWIIYYIHKIISKNRNAIVYSNWDCYTLLYLQLFMNGFFVKKNAYIFIYMLMLLTCFVFLPVTQCILGYAPALPMTLSKNKQAIEGWPLIRYIIINSSF